MSEPRIAHEEDEWAQYDTPTLFDELDPVSVIIEEMEGAFTIRFVRS